MIEERGLQEPVAGRRERLEQIARAFLAPRSPAPLRVAVAGPDDPGPPGLATEALAEAAVSLGLPCRRGPSMDCGVPDDATEGPGLVLLDQGGVDETRLTGLSSHPPDGVDLLVWTFRPVRGERLRSVYLLGMWCWAHSPHQVRCLLPPNGPEPERLEPQLERISDAAHFQASPQIVRLPTSIGGEGWRVPLLHLLQGALSGHRPARPKAAGPGRRDGWMRGIARAGIACLVAGAAALVGLGPAWGQPDGEEGLIVRLEGLKPTARWDATHPDLESIVAGPGFSLQFRGAAGAWSPDSSRVDLAVMRQHLSVRVGERYLDFVEGAYKLEQPAIVVAPGFRAVVIRGWVEFQGQVLTLSAGGGATGLGGKPKGWWASIVLLAAIAMLFWTGSLHRRRLREPRHSVRHRGPPTGGS